MTDEPKVRVGTEFVMELPGPVARFHKEGEEVFVVLKDGRSFPLSMFVTDAPKDTKQ